MEILLPWIYNEDHRWQFLWIRLLAWLSFYEFSILCLETAMWSLDCGHRACNVRAITRRNLRAKSHPEALSATSSGV